MIDNKEYCRSIAQTFEQYASGQMHKCPYCDEIISDDGNDLEKCPECGHDLTDDKLEDMGLIDYLENVFDIEITRSGLSKDGRVRSVRICVAYGGPNVYIDSKKEAVELFWWGDRAEWGISCEACTQLEELIEELTY